MAIRIGYMCINKKTLLYILPYILLIRLVKWQRFICVSPTTILQDLKETLVQTSWCSAHNEVEKDCRKSKVCVHYQVSKHRFAESQQIRWYLPGTKKRMIKTTEEAVHVLLQAES